MSSVEYIYVNSIVLYAWALAYCVRLYFYVLCKLACGILEKAMINHRKSRLFTISVENFEV